MACGLVWEKGSRNILSGSRRISSVFRRPKCSRDRRKSIFPAIINIGTAAERKGYSGTAVFTRQQPLSVSYDIGVEEHSHEGRVITLEMESFYLVTVYTPNSQDKLARIDYRMKWEDDFREYITQLDRKKPVIICGDMNVAHEEIDLKNPKTNRGMRAFPTRNGKR